MPSNPLEGWTPWPQSNEPFALGRLGYSLKSGDVKVDLYPVMGTRDTLTAWEAVGWTGEDRGATLFTFHAETHWECAALVNQYLKEHTA